MNFLDVEVRMETGGAAWIAYDGRRLADLPCTIDAAKRQALRETLQAGIRPNRVKYSETWMQATDLAGEVGTYESIGERGVLTVRLQSQDLTIHTPPDLTFRKAQRLWIHCPLEHMYFFFKRDRGKTSSGFSRQEINLMKAMVLTGIKKIEIVEQPVPALRHPTDVLLRIIRAGICGSDLHYYTQGRIGEQIVKYPFCIGHECSAVVVEVGKEAERFKPGDLVVVDPSVSCNTCDQCRLGHFHTCRTVRFLGCPGQLQGCLCDLMVMPEGCCYSANGLTADQAALVEPLTIGHYAVQLAADDLKGRKVAILGSGPIGLSVLLSAQVAGAFAIYMTDRMDYRLETARRQGATWTGNPDRTDIVRDIIQQEPLELDVVFECCGQQTALDQAMKLCKPMGRLVIVGIPETHQSSFPIHDARRKGLTFINVRRQNECIDPVIELIRTGRLKPDFMITHRFSLDKAAKAFELLADYSDGIVKAIVDIG